MDTSPGTKATAVGRGLLLGGLLYALVVACATFVPRHGWDPSFGPVVPHDGFPADCSLCHEGDDWHTMRADFTYDHEKMTGTALAGAHADAGCLMCHNDRGPVQMFAARGCAGCHDDPHLQRLGNNCRDCHDEETWQAREAIARHDRTRFPLVGAHAAIACFRCHAGAQVGNFAGASPECSHCHQRDRARATSPDHSQPEYSFDCDRCHLPVAWRPAFFDHPASFPLTNSHARPCAACHTASTYSGLDPACVSCHLGDYQATTNPPHAASQFGQQCQSCHGTVSWVPSTFRHQFPLTGPHNLGCADCHPAAGGGAQFTCTNCHAHQQAEMADDHSEVAGYSWTSTACYSCHPNGRN